MFFVGFSFEGQYDLKNFYYIYCCTSVSLGQLCCRTEVPFQILFFYHLFSCVTGKINSKDHYVHPTMRALDPTSRQEDCNSTLTRLPDLCIFWHHLQKTSIRPVALFALLARLCPYTALDYFIYHIWENTLTANDSYQLFATHIYNSLNYNYIKKGKMDWRTLQSVFLPLA